MLADHEQVCDDVALFINTTTILVVLLLELCVHGVPVCVCLCACGLCVNEWYDIVHSSIISFIKCQPVFVWICTLDLLL